MKTKAYATTASIDKVDVNVALVRLAASEVEDDAGVYARLMSAWLDRRARGGGRSFTWIDADDVSRIRELLKKGS